MQASEAIGALHFFNQLQLTLMESESLYEKSLSLCEAFGTYLTTYDAAYLALAQNQKAWLWTADRRFFYTVSPIFNEIKLV